MLVSSNALRVSSVKRTYLHHSYALATISPSSPKRVHVACTLLASQGSTMPGMSGVVRIFRGRPRRFFGCSVRERARIEFPGARS